MTVLSVNTAAQAKTDFASKGRYTYLRLLFLFGLDWYVELNWVRDRIACLSSGIGFATLFRDIITADARASGWAAHAQARDHIWQAYEDCERAWSHVLAASPDRDQLALEYLADALTRFREATRCP